MSAMDWIHTNNAQGSLFSALTKTDTLLKLQYNQGIGFPYPGPNQRFKLTIEDRVANLLEIVDVTSHAGDLFVVERAREGTLAREWAAGTTVSHRVTAEVLNNVVRVGGPYLPSSGGTMTGTLHVPIVDVTDQLCLPAGGTAGHPPIYFSDRSGIYTGGPTAALMEFVGNGVNIGQLASSTKVLPLPRSIVTRATGDIRYLLTDQAKATYVAKNELPLYLEKRPVVEISDMRPEPLDGVNGMLWIVPAVGMWIKQDNAWEPVGVING